MSKTIPPSSNAPGTGDYDPLAHERPIPMLETFGASVTGWSEGYARVEMPISDRVINRQGIVHGGALMTLMDSAGGYAGCYLAIPCRVRKAMTLSMTTNFVSVARGKRLIAEGRMTRGGRSIFFADVTISDETGELIATGTGTFRYRSASQNPDGEPAD
ncbi:MAG: PaaI family thioesterase [Pseudomonadota bacterium]